MFNVSGGFNAAAVPQSPTVSLVVSSQNPFVGDTVSFDLESTNVTEVEWSKIGNITLSSTSGNSITALANSAGEFTVTALATGPGGTTAVSFTGYVSDSDVGIAAEYRFITVESNELVILDSNRAQEDSQVVWSQVVGEAVQLSSNNNSTTASFTSTNNYNYETVLLFRVVELSDTLYTVDYVCVTVNKATSPSKRIANVIAKARVTLGDKSKDRYSDEEMVILVDEAQTDFCKQTKILKEFKEIQVIDGEAFVDLPEDCWMLTRASYNNKKFSLLTYADVDAIIRNDSTPHTNFTISAGWEGEVGEPKALIYDKNNLGRVRIYPIPDTALNEQTSDFGLLTDIDALVNDGSSSSDYGASSSSSSSYGVLRIYYVKMPEEVTQLTDNLDMPKMFDVALKYYITGQSFLNDLDSGWQEKGLQQLRFYEREVEAAKKSEASNHARTGEFKTNYRSGF